jgi:hypothetical protein
MPGALGPVSPACPGRRYEALTRLCPPRQKHPNAGQASGSLAELGPAKPGRLSQVSSGLIRRLFRLAG